MHVRATARTNGGASAQATTPGTCSKPQNPFACGTQALSRFRGCLFAVCFQAHGAMCSGTWRRGRGETPCRSARPFGESRDKNDRRALGPDETRGDDVRLICSPDGAQRNPGYFAAELAPDFAALHPGYGPNASGCLTIEETIGAAGTACQFIRLARPPPRARTIAVGHAAGCRDAQRARPLHPQHRACEDNRADAAVP